MNEREKLISVLDAVKESFVGKDEIIDLLGIALIAKENAFLLGPPGTAKSAIVRAISRSIKDGNNFEYLLTRFTEPSEIFGPFDIRKLKEGELTTNTQGMLPEASLVFLDEIFNANSAILNSLLMALNERIFKRGRETKKLPALMFVGASNQLPDDEALNALLDRFLIRVRCDYVNPELLGEVLLAGRKLESNLTRDPITISPEEVIILQNKSKEVILTPILSVYRDLVHNLRNSGINISDRRAVKIQNIIASSAVICGRQEADISDLWVLKYVWDSEEQIEILAGMVDKILTDVEPIELPHPQSNPDNSPNSEDLKKELDLISSKLEDSTTNFEEQNILKDKLRFLQSRVSWILNEDHKKLLESQIEEIWKSLLTKV